MSIHQLPVSILALIVNLPEVKDNDAFALMRSIGNGQGGKCHTYADVMKHYKLKRACQYTPDDDEFR